MRTALGVTLISAVLALVTANTADASYCGAARYGRCSAVCCVEACCPQQTCTVMKTLPRDRLRAAADDLLQDGLRAGVRAKTVSCVKYVPETRYRECHYTVCKPVWETRTKEVCYTVCKPVQETRTCTYTVCKPVWETCTKQIPYTVCKPVWETRTKESSASRSTRPGPARTRFASRSRDADLHLHGCKPVQGKTARRKWPTRSASRLTGLGNLHQGNSLYGLQAGV